MTKTRNDTLATQSEVAKRWIGEARKITVLTGAGISTESGVPDFRGPDGVWTKNPEAEKMATIHHYMSNPDIRKMAWQTKLKSSKKSPQPNPGHRALVSLERTGKLVGLITQNVDGLHQDAGSNPEIVIEVHGTVRLVECTGCGARAPMKTALKRVEQGEPDPHCLDCGGILKSAAILFGQGLVPEVLRQADWAARSCDLMIAIGTTLSVYPVAGVVPLAKESGARVLIINGEPTEMDSIADLVLQGPIGQILPQLISID